MKARTVVVLVAAFALAGCGGGAEKKGGEKPDAKAPLGERIGGEDAIKTVVKDCVEVFVAKDERINARFAKADVPHLEQMLSQQLAEAAGCAGAKYTGKDMKHAHAGMGISMGEFNAFVDDLSRALDKNGVKPADRDELLGKLAPLKDQIVEKP